MSIVRANAWQNINGVAYNSILQVVSVNKTDSWSGTSTQSGTGYFIDVPGMAATITPYNANSKILVMVNMYIGLSTTSSGYQQQIRIRRNGTYPIIGSAEGTRPRVSGRVNFYANSTYYMGMMTGTYLDTPNINAAVTYQVEMGGYSGTPVVYVNRSESHQDSANDYNGIPVSSITLMEIAQ